MTSISQMQDPITKPHIIIVDDDAAMRMALSQWLELSDFDVTVYEDAREALRDIRPDFAGVILTDVKMPKLDGITFTKSVLSADSDIPVILMTGHGDVPMAVEAMKSGAYDFVEKPFEPKDIVESLERAIEKRRLVLENRQLRQQIIHRSSLDSRLIGNSLPMRALKDEIANIAPTEVPVLISGETGTGKELVARLIHELGARQAGPFVPINCGAIPAELVESEFFGHKKGAFTGAVADKQGLFQAADGGTLFLDEVADLPLMMQVKLLRAIQEKAVRPVGGHEEVNVDVRILSATHKNLATCVRDGSFREDLYYRLNVIELNVPPLRERQADIPQLADHILSQLAANNKMTKPLISAAAMKHLQSYHFPGNVRELENILERALTWADEGADIDVNDLMLPETQPAVSSQQPVKTEADKPGASTALDLESKLEDQERQLIMQALESTRWNKTAAAKKLGITFRALRYKLKKLELD